MTKPWKWVRSKAGILGTQYEWVLYDGRGRNRANVWPNGVWHSWDTDGVGGENGAVIRMNGTVPVPDQFVLQDAMDQAMAAVARQGWTPWKIEYVRSPK